MLVSDGFYADDDGDGDDVEGDDGEDGEGDDDDGDDSNSPNIAKCSLSGERPAVCERVPSLTRSATNPPSTTHFALL